MQKIVVIAVYLIFILLLYLTIYFALGRNTLKRMTGMIDKCPFALGQRFEVVKKLGFVNPAGVYSCSLYGPDKPDQNFIKRYIQPLYNRADKLIQIRKHQLKDWYLRVYISANLPAEITDELVNKECQVYIMNPSPKGHEGALWRFYPAAENIPFVSIDADDNFSARDATSIQRWLKSDKQFYIKNHFGTWYWAMTAGRWGARPLNGVPPVSDIEDRIAKYCEHWFGFDEAFLRREIWPIAQENYITDNDWTLYSLNAFLVILIIAVLMFSFYYLFTR